MIKNRRMLRFQMNFQTILMIKDTSEVVRIEVNSKDLHQDPDQLI